MASRLIALICGLVLLSASVLKLTSGATSPLGQNAVLFSPSVRMAVIEAELLIGLWLLSGYRPRAAGLIAAAFFGLLAAVSLWLAVQGQSTCNCFGRVVVHPWATFGLDVAAAVALLLFRSPSTEIDRIPLSISGPAKAVGGAVIMLSIGAVGLMVHWQTDFPTVVARLRGESLTIEPAYTDLGPGAEGDRQEFVVVIVNRTDRPVRLIGGSASCPCAVVDELPLTVSAHGRLPLTMKAVFRGTPGLFENELYLFTDDKQQGQLTARFGGTLVVR